ncbi:MAG: hypothetical protein KBE65_22855 [Phycisphaerae bacterium]|nr:hypothetical protein [Phycisphaerae bacterium]
MLRNVFVTIVVGILSVGVLVGCSKKADQPPVQQEQTKTAAEYKADADKQITEENVDAELAKLEKDLDADANAADANEVE